MSYVYDKFIFHFIVDRGIIFLCMADEDLKRRIAFSFLDKIKTLWREQYSLVEENALPFQMNENFSPILKQNIENYSNDKINNLDNLSRVQNQLDAVKDIMVIFY